MTWLRTFSVWIVGLCIPFLLTACSPVQPIVRDGAGQSLPILNAAISDIHEVARSGIFDDPIDAAPNPTGDVIYFTATSATGPGVFRVATEGGDPAAICVGAPFADVRGLPATRDGQAICVAARGARRGGRIAAMSSGGTCDGHASRRYRAVCASRGPN